MLCIWLINFNAPNVLADLDSGVNLLLVAQIFSSLSQQPQLCCLRREPVRKFAESIKKETFSAWNEDTNDKYHKYIWLLSRPANLYLSFHSFHLSGCCFSLTWVLLICSVTSATALLVEFRVWYAGSLSGNCRQNSSMFLIPFSHKAWGSRALKNVWEKNVSLLKKIQHF